MLPDIVQMICIFMISFLTGLIGTRLCRMIACRFGIVDHPDDTVKTHSRPTAYLGGVGILIGVLSGLFGYKLFLASSVSYDFVGRPGWIAMAAGGICLVGLVDDLLDISPLQKVFGQMSAAFIAAFFLKSVYVDLFPGLPGWTAVVIALFILLFFVIGATNSINLLDGLDGLCAGVTILICINFFVLTRMIESPYSQCYAVLTLSLAGAVAGFLVFNYPPASIFMGDAGSLLIGLLLACQLVLFLMEGVAVFLASLMIFGFPILDTSVAILRRLLNGKPLFVSDRGHIYDQFVDRGMSKHQSIWICYGLTALSSCIGLIGYRIGSKVGIPLYISTVIITFLIIWKKNFLKKG